MTNASFSIRVAAPFAKPKRERVKYEYGRPATRVARMIALAHHVDDLLRRGEISSYGEVGRALGVTDTRMTHICDLALLSPRIQEALLLGEVVMSPRKAQKLIKLGLWKEQERGFDASAVGGNNMRCSPERKPNSLPEKGGES